MYGGGICINCLANIGTVINSSINFGTLVVINKNNPNYNTANVLGNNINITGTRLLEKLSSNNYEQVLSNNLIFSVNDVACATLIGYGKSDTCNTVTIGTCICQSLICNTVSYMNFYKIDNCYTFRYSSIGNERFSTIIITGGVLVGQADPSDKRTIQILDNCISNNVSITTKTIFIYSGKIEKSSTSWHHKPNSSTATTWKYADHFIPPHKSLHLKISRMVEAASSSSEARVAVTDTVNWYPETKFGALAETVISGIEPDKWQTYSLKWRNDSDEPQQVRVWECASGSTDAGYLNVDVASGGAF